jgi:pSer/pThr/pTyr-binding forkhead associated (FHA) protein
MPSSSFLYEQPEALLIHVNDPELPLHIADYRLSRDEVTTIGRQADVHLLINESSVSRHHAQISYTNGLYLLRDLGSMNGTYVNDIRIDPNQPHMLRAEDLVRIGLKTEFKFVVRLRTTPDTQAPQSAPRPVYSSPAEERAPTVALSTEHTLQRPPTAVSSEKRLPPDQAVQLAPPSVPALIILPETVLEELDGSPRIYLLSSNKRIAIGRALGNDIEIIDPNVSRRHAEIFADPTGYFIRDLNSSHGVQVNGHKIDRPYHLSHGDRIVLGGSMLFFVDLQSGKEQTSQMQPIDSLTTTRPRPEPAVPAYPQRRTTAYLQEPPEIRAARRPVSVSTNKIPVQVVICSRCGVANMPVARFCASCSAPLSINDAR